MSVPQLWTKNRPIAYAISREWRIPGLDRDDVDQEALVALWEAARSYDPAKGPFKPFARLVIERRLTDQLRRATRRIDYRLIQFGRELDLVALDTLEGRERLATIFATIETFSPAEREAFAQHLNGRAATHSKQHNNALSRGREKLRSALAA